MKNALRIGILWLLLAAAARAGADGLVGVQRTGALSPAHLNARLHAVFGTQSPAPATQPVALYAVRYRSANVKGRPCILSGLLALPQGGAPRGLVVFAHGTTADRRLSPSRFGGAVRPPEAEAALLAFASGGYAVAMPDYLGLGVDKEVHPYPFGNLNSRSATDLIGPARDAARRLHTAVGPRLFITGYSEGGAVALWAVRNLEQKPGALYRVSAAAPMAGPYDLSVTTARSLIAPSSDPKLFVAHLYLLSYLLHSAHKEDGLRLSKYVHPVLGAVIAHVFDKGLSDADIVKRLVVTAALCGAKNSMARITTAHLRRVLSAGDGTDPLMRALQAADCCDWSPRTPLLLICLHNDALVPPENTAKTLSLMRARGVGPQTVQAFVIQTPGLDHGSAVMPSLARARRFFDSRPSGNK